MQVINSAMFTNCTNLELIRMLDGHRAKSVIINELCARLYVLGEPSKDDEDDIREWTTDCPVCQAKLDIAYNLDKDLLDVKEQ